MKICKTKNKDKILLWFHLENKNTKKLIKKKKRKTNRKSYSNPPLCCLNIAFNERVPFLKILGSSFRFMFPNFYLSAFNFTNDYFQMVNVKISSFSGVYIYTQNL